jgi:hypothetical protein
MTARHRRTQRDRDMARAPDLYARVSRVERDRDGAFLTLDQEEAGALDRLMAEKESARG